MKKQWLLAAILLILCLTVLILLGSGNNARSIADPATGPPNRIVSTAPNLTEILFALDLDEKIVGVSNDSKYPAEARQKPNTGTFWQPDIEAIIALKPDLVLTLAFPQQKMLAERLRRMRYNTLTLDIVTVEGFYAALEEIGSATGSTDRAMQLKQDITTKLTDLAGRTASAARPKVLWVVQRKPLRVAGTDTFVNEMIELAGGRNAIGRTIHKFPPIGAEQVIASAPDVIIEPIMGAGSIAAQKAEANRYWGRFQSLPARQNERIYVIDGDAVSQLGPRLYEGVNLIALHLNPELSRN